MIYVGKRVLTYVWIELLRVLIEPCYFFLSVGWRTWIGTLIGKLFFLTFQSLSAYILTLIKMLSEYLIE